MATVFPLPLYSWNPQRHQTYWCPHCFPGSTTLQTAGTAMANTTPGDRLSFVHQSFIWYSKHLESQRNNYLQFLQKHTGGVVLLQNQRKTIHILYESIEFLQKLHSSWTITTRPMTYHIHHQISRSGWTAPRRRKIYFQVQFSTQEIFVSRYCRGRKSMHALSYHG